MLEVGITGASGFVGRVLCKRMLQQAEMQMWVAVRGGSLGCLRWRGACALCSIAKTQTCACACNWLDGACRCPPFTVVHDAQRNSLRPGKHLRWHLTSLVKFWCSATFWRYWFIKYRGNRFCCY